MCVRMPNAVANYTSGEHRFVDPVYNGSISKGYIEIPIPGKEATRRADGRWKRGEELTIMDLWVGL